MVYQCEKQLNELGDKAPKELKETIDGILSKSKKVLENQDSSLAELKDAKDSLQKTFEQLGQEAMKHAGSTGAAGTSTESENKASSDSEKSDTKSKEEDIVDADFEVVDEADKKEINLSVRYQICRFRTHNLTNQTKPKKKENE